MQSSHALLTTLTIVLSTAAVTTIVFQRWKQPVVLGYLVAGMIVGPHVPLPIAADVSATHTLSELGVILLMFSLGLELSLRKLFGVGLKAAFVGVVQSSLMIWLGFTVGRALGWTPTESLYAGGVIAISSTTIIVKAFSDAGVRGKLRDVVFGILVVEDLVAVLLLTIFTAISSGAAVSPASLALTAARLGAFLLAMLVVGLLAVPRLIRLVVRLDRPETTVVAAMGLCFFCALLCERAGYSVALGAFVAGSLIAESGEERPVERVVEPVRDVFGAIFFVSVGMLIDPRLVAQNWVATLLLTAAVVAGKIVFVALASFLTGSGLRLSVQSGMSLAQIGELSFVIAGLGLSSGATRDFLYPVAVAVSALTTLLTPWLIRAAGPVAARLDRSLPPRLQTFVTLYGAWLDRVTAPTPGERGRLARLVRILLADAVVFAAIVIGASLAADRATEWISGRTGAPHETARAGLVIAAAALASPFVVGAVRTARHLGVALATRSMPSAEGTKLDLAAAPRHALVVMMQLGIVFLFGAPLLAVTQPFLPPFYGALIFAALLAVLAVRFYRSANELHGHVQAASRAIAEALAAQARSTPDDAKPHPLDDVVAHLPGMGAPVALRLRPDSHAAGKSLAQLDLRNLTGASVLAITTADGVPEAPSPTRALEPGDTLAIAGSAEALAAATLLLEKGPEAAPA
jgi:CPA2 family monovalent cation:H+ antiporter-2